MKISCPSASTSTNNRQHPLRAMSIDNYLPSLTCLIMLLFHANSFSRQVIISPHKSLLRRATFPSIHVLSAERNDSNSSLLIKKEGLTNSRNVTGGLRHLPILRPPNELLSRSRKVVAIVKSDKEVKNVRARARKHGAETINALILSLCLPLRDTVDGYRRVWRSLHPFEQVVFDLSIRARQKKDGMTLDSVLNEINEARKSMLEYGKKLIKRVKEAPTAKEASDFTKEGVESLLKMFEEVASSPVANLVDLQKELRSSPVVDLKSPAVVLVGAPNVGKSSIVRAISSASPEVNNYPFTTRGMTLGHIEVFWSDEGTISKAIVPEHNMKRKRPYTSPEDAGGRYAFSQLCQVMDSPGILVRPDSERNEMESLTLATMQHLPTCVMYVMDLSGAAGDKCSSIEDQLALRQEIRARFPRRPWIDVVSKVDLGIDDGAIKKLQSIMGEDSPYVKLSLHEEIGLGELKSRVLQMLEDMHLILQVMNSSKDER
jgi:nucleolar GTP-binding protein